MSDLISMLAGAAGGGVEEVDPYFSQTTLLLHGDGTNGGQNNTFVDSSANGFSMTRVGIVTQGSESPYSVPDGYWAVQTGSGGGCITSASDARFGTGTGNFTLECWIYATAAFQAGENVFVSNSTTGGFLIGFANGNLYIASQAQGLTVQAAWTPVYNQWIHIAGVRNGSTGTIYVNGTSIGSGSYTTNNPSGAITIGANSSANNLPFTGYISNARVSDIARYTSNFTPSTTPLTSDANTLLLTAQSPYYKDNSGTPLLMSKTGGPISYTFSPFAPPAAYNSSTNGGSMYFNQSTSTYLYTADNAAFDFGTSPFTIEAWINCNSSRGNYDRIVSGGDDSNGANQQWFFGFWPGSYFNFGWNNGSGYTEHAFDIGSIGGIPDNTWGHVALVRNGTSVTVYWNGRAATPWTISSGDSINTGSSGLFVGARLYNGSITEPWAGFISNLRIVKGTAVYTSNFTPPTAPLTAISGTSLLLLGTNAEIYDNSSRATLLSAGDAQISTSVKKYGTGSLYFDGTGDYLVRGRYSSLYAFGNGNFTVECWVNTTQSANYPSAVGRWSNSLGQSWDLRATSVDASGKPLFAFNDGTSVTVIASSGSTITDGTWHHLAAVRNGNTITLYVDGTSVGSTSFSGSIADRTSTPLYIGYNDTNSYQGYIDDVRITKGIARYTANFTPPTKAFPNL